MATLESGRMRLLGDLMEGDAIRLGQLAVVRPELYADYLASAERLRELQAAQWAAFQPSADFETGGFDLR